MRPVQDLRLAVMMLTRLPMGQLTAPVPTLAQAAWGFPLVGLVTGLLCWVVLQVALWLGLAPVVAALMALGAVIWLTGGLHEDGLADVADGLGGGRDRVQCLEIMRDSRIGSYGVVALVFMIALKTGALAEIAGDVTLPALVFVAVASRLAMLAVLIRVAPARADGLGAMASGPRARAMVPGALAATVLAIWLGPTTGIVIAVMAVAAAIMAALAYRRIGGQTGDVLGAVQAVSETAGLLALSVLLA